MQWNQNYYAVGGSVFITALCAALPILFLFWALAIQKMKGYLAIFIACSDGSAKKSGIYC